jgi:hypothetical protein
VAATDSPLRAIALRLSATIEELFELERQQRAASAAAAYRVDTLSKSLAEPFKHQVELTLSNAQAVIQDDGDRAALAAVARASHGAGLLDDGALARLLREYSIQ